MLARHASGVDYLKKELALTGGHWSGFQVPVLWRRGRGKILLLGDSDDELTNFRFRLLRVIGGYKRVSSTHLSKDFGPNSRPLPLGLPYEEGYGFPFDVLGDLSILREVFRESPPAVSSRLRVFGAFSDETHPSRKQLKSYIKESNRGIWGDYPVTRFGRRSYLADMRECGLVVCPPGRGLDTYRFWEAIYVGSVPILLNPPQIYLQMIRGLPFIVVQSWQELEDFAALKVAWESFQRTPLDYSSAAIDRVWLHHTVG